MAGMAECSVRERPKPDFLQPLPPNSQDPWVPVPMGTRTGHSHIWLNTRDAPTLHCDKGSRWGF